jgi:hypothetical protein
MASQEPGKVDWVAVCTLLCTVVTPVVTTIIGLGLYLFSRLNQIDSRLNEFDVNFARIETRMGIDAAPAKKIATR